MIKTKHIFHDNTNVDGNGIDYVMENKSTSMIMAVSCGDLNETPTATAATLTFYGKSAGSQEFVAIKALKASDYSLNNTGSIDEVYLIDCSPYQTVRVALSSVIGGSVTVIGEVVE